MMTPEVAHEHTKGIAETAMIVSALRILLRSEYNLQNSGAIDIAYGIVQKHGLIGQDGGWNIPPELWALINADRQTKQ